ncbi:hypothetical protein EK21DRAFT_119388 [Setomelanomma holmii]|uniref:Uncharacterized protein n=1 Tax=Setomelanomma holmii TaxID=210430 RepID=A0A9P4LFP0_9PLEO|nr:hypothetical protein EK21DRAFT_119388 [Setomelanomma holmii]
MTTLQWPENVDPSLLIADIRCEAIKYVKCKDLVSALGAADEKIDQILDQAISFEHQPTRRVPDDYWNMLAYHTKCNGFRREADEPPVDFPYQQSDENWTIPRHKREYNLKYLELLEELLYQIFTERSELDGDSIGGHGVREGDIAECHPDTEMTLCDRLFTVDDLFALTCRTVDKDGCRDAYQAIHNHLDAATKALDTHREGSNKCILEDNLSNNVDEFKLREADRNYFRATLQWYGAHTRAIACAVDELAKIFKKLEAVLDK